MMASRQDDDMMDEFVGNDDQAGLFTLDDEDGYGDEADSDLFGPINHTPDANLMGGSAMDGRALFDVPDTMDGGVNNNNNLVSNDFGNKIDAMMMPQSIENGGDGSSSNNDGGQVVISEPEGSGSLSPPNSGLTRTYDDPLRALDTTTSRQQNEAKNNNDKSNDLLLFNETSNNTDPHPTQDNNNSTTASSSSSMLSPLTSKFQGMTMPSISMPASLSWSKTPASPEQQQPTTTNTSPKATPALTAPPPAAAPPVAPPLNYVYGTVAVGNPIMMETGGMLGTSSSYWMYEITTQINEESVTVKRRFKNIVALEDRLRGSKPGVIFPPRPDKCLTLPLEEGHLRQSLEFAKKRAKRMKQYLTDLLSHPLIGITNNPDLHNFLTLQHDLSLAWPECSVSTLTRMGVAVGSSIKGTFTSEDLYAKAATIGHKVEDPDDELAAMTEAEKKRIETVNQAVPKLHAMLKLWKDYGDATCAAGMELSKLAKDTKRTDPPLSQSVEPLGQPLLKLGRRIKKMSTDLEDGGLLVLEREYRRGKNELAAFDDRRRLLHKLIQKQMKMNRALMDYETAQAEVAVWGNYRLGTMQRDLQVAEEEATKALGDVQEVGDVLKGEVVRQALERRREWFESLKVVAEDIVKTKREEVALWEGVLAKCEGEVSSEEEDVVGLIQNESKEEDSN